MCFDVLFFLHLPCLGLVEILGFRVVVKNSIKQCYICIPYGQEAREKTEHAK